jgi:hypothetical protein
MLSSYDNRKWWLRDERLGNCAGPYSTEELYVRAHEYNIKHWYGDADPIALCINAGAIWDDTGSRLVAVLTLAEDNY